MLSMRGHNLNLYSVCVQLSLAITVYTRKSVKFILSMRETAFVYTEYAQKYVLFILSMRGISLGLYSVTSFRSYSA
jgi:hypothetical protein